MGMFEVAVQRRLPGAGMNGDVIMLVEPPVEGLIELFQGEPLGARTEKLHAQGAEEPFYFSPALGLVGGGVNQGDAQRRSGVSQQIGSEGRAVVHVEFPRQTSFRKGDSQCGGVVFHPFMAKELGVTDQPAHVIDEGEEIGFSLFPLYKYPRAVHTVGLPDVVGQFRFESSAIHRGDFPFHQTPLFEQTIDGGGMHFDARMEYLPEVCLPQNDRKRCPLQLLPELHQGKDRFLVEDAGPPPIAPGIRVEALDSAPTLLVPSGPKQNRRDTDETPLGTGRLPCGGRLLQQQPLLLSSIELSVANKIVNHPKPKLRNPSFSFFVHSEHLLKDFRYPYQRRQGLIDARRRWGKHHMRSGAKCSVAGKILAERNDSRCAEEGSFTFSRREAHVLRQRYQYCWFCRTTPLTDRKS